MRQREEQRRRKPYKQGLGKALPNKIPMGQNERTANYGTSVESCSVTSALLPLSVSFTISTLGRIGKRQFLKTFSLLLIQHRQDRRVLALAKLFSFFFSQLLR